MVLLAQLGPDRLALPGVARAPALGELGDEQQAASAFVEGAGPAQVGVVLPASDTSHSREESRMRRRRMGGRP